MLSQDLEAREQLVVSLHREKGHSRQKLSMTAIGQGGVQGYT